MRLDEPRWWYRSERGLAETLLSPVACVWNRVAMRRFKAIRPYRPSLPVICVGNFTAGGSGKTPMALYLASRLAMAGTTPYMLTRGYGGREAGPRFVDPANDRSGDVGDEALLLANIAPTVIARDRVAGARLIEEEAARRRTPAAIVMDDGLQNPALAKDLTVAMVDAGRGIGNGRVIPAGPLRIALDFQIGLADAIVFNHRDAPEASDTLAGSAGKPHWVPASFPGPLLDAWPAPQGDTAWLSGRDVIAFAGIVNPERFFAMIDRLGGRCRERIAFPDHHPFTASDAQSLLDRARATGSLLVSTEKDLIRLRGATGALGDLSEAARAITIAITLSGRDSARLASLIDTAIDRRSGHLERP